MRLIHACNLYTGVYGTTDTFNHTMLYDCMHIKITVCWPNTDLFPIVWQKVLAFFCDLLLIGIKETSLSFRCSTVIAQQQRNCDRFKIIIPYAGQTLTCNSNQLHLWFRFKKHRYEFHNLPILCCPFVVLFQQTMSKWRKRLHLF